MVSSEESDAVWVLQLEAEEQLEGLDRVVTAINEISHEDVACVGNLTTLFEEFQKIVELSMNVTADGNWCTDWLHVAFLNQDFLDFFTKKAEVALWQNSTVLDSSEP